jgi:N-methylhydantoinase B
MKIDPITLEVIRNRLEFIADEMEISLLKSAYSSIIQEALDASAAIFDVKGQTIVQATALPVQLAMLIPAVKSIIDAYPPNQMKEGDIYLMNDPYLGGTHLPDITVLAPVIYQGKTLALSANMAHHQDLGGKVAGSVPSDATEIFQEGLIMPPMKFYDQGKPNETLHTIIQKNVRIPYSTMGDFRAQIASCNIGINRLKKLFDEYGGEETLMYVEELFNRAEKMTRERISEIPDGDYTFEDYIDNDGVELDRRIKVKVKITVKGSDILVDFTGTDPQVKGPINCVPSPSMASVYFMIKAITDPSIPNNAGCYRSVRGILPEGSLVNPRFPAAVNARAITAKRIVDLLFGALSKPIPDRVTAASSGNVQIISFGGIDPLTGKAFAASDLGAGGMGARPTKDGIDRIETDITNCMNVPVESLEMKFPLKVIKNNLWDDSGGAGKYRGGLGFEKWFEVVRGEIVVSHRGDRHFTQPWGLFGGKAAPCWESYIVRKDGSREKIKSKKVFYMMAGDQLHLYAAGGGGYGDPLEREIDSVLDDVINGKVSIKKALEDYGVVVEGTPLRVNLDKTMKKRKSLKNKRGPITWTFDRGELGCE